MRHAWKIMAAAVSLLLLLSSLGCLVLKTRSAVVLSSYSPPPAPILVPITPEQAPSSAAVKERGDDGSASDSGSSRRARMRARTTQFLADSITTLLLGDKSLSAFVTSRQHSKCIKVFAGDYHPAVVADLKWLLPFLPFCVELVHQDLSVQCAFFKSCQTGLKVLQDYTLYAPPANTKALLGDWGVVEAFYLAYRDVFRGNQTGELLTKDIDVFLCTHPVAMCEFYAAFNRRMIYVQAVPLWFTRHWPRPWGLIDQYESGVLYSNNGFHGAQTKWATQGRLDPPVIPSFCGYALETLADDAVAFGWEEVPAPPVKKIRVGFHRYLNGFQLQAGLSEDKYELVVASSLEVAASCQVLVLAPYTASLMTGFEWARLAIPVVYTWSIMWDTFVSANSAKQGDIPPDPTLDIAHPPWLREKAAWLNLTDFETYPNFYKVEELSQVGARVALLDLDQERPLLQAENRAKLVRSVMNWSKVFQTVMALPEPNHDPYADTVSEWYETRKIPL
jgi:hypothetical protein